MDLPRHIFVSHKGTFQCYSKASKTLEWFAPRLCTWITPRRTLDDSEKCSALFNETNLEHKDENLVIKNPIPRGSDTYDNDS